MIYAYLRVSTTIQDEQNQRQGVDLKAEKLGLHIDKYIIDRVSGTKEPDQRNLGKLLRRAKTGDIIIISEMSRLGRRLFMLFRIMEELLNKGVQVYSVKENFTLDNTLQGKTLIFAFGLAAEIERDMISARTREALAYRKSLGVVLGRPKGSKTKHHKLDPYREKIEKWRAKGWSKAKISRKTKVCDKTLRKYMNQNSLV